jgi:lipoyl(octanoyl) transferase
MIAVNLSNKILNYSQLQQLNQYLLYKSDQFLILSQVDPVFTVGLRSLQEAHFKYSSNVPIIKTNRGGQVTFHGPGQLMVYPIICLRSQNLKVKEYIGILEDIAIDACQRVNVQAIRTCDTGVWTARNSKIASIGIHVSKGKTAHGLALNCNLDLKYFDQIVPCGLSQEKSITSLTKELQNNVTPQQMSPFVIDACKRFFKQDVVELRDPGLIKEIENIIN